MHHRERTTFSSKPFPARPMQEAQKAAQPPLILVIDDSPTIRKILQVTLERAGYRVQSFADGVEAMHWLSHPCSPIPNLLLLDVALPKLDGFTVAHRLRSQRALQHLVIIMLSRHSGVLPRLKARLVGVSAYLVKPVPTQELLTIVASHLAHARAVATETPVRGPSNLLSSPTAGSAINIDAPPG